MPFESNLLVGYLRMQMVEMAILKGRFVRGQDIQHRRKTLSG